MSRTTFGLLEIYNKVTGKWESARVNFAIGDVEQKQVDFYLGGSGAAGALFGENLFDFKKEDYEEEAPNKKSRYLDEIESWFNERNHHSQCVDGASAETIATLRHYDDAELPYHFIPDNINFTYADLLDLKKTAALISKRAKNYYKRNFTRVENIFQFVYSNYTPPLYVIDKSEIRLIVYVV